MSVLRSMLLGSALRLYSPPDDPPAAAPVVVDPPEPEITPDVEPAVAAAAEPPAGDDDPADPPADPPVPAAPAKDWKDKELGRKHRQLQEAKQRAADLEAENADLRALASRGAPATDPPADPPAPAAPRPAAPTGDMVPRSEVRGEAERIIAKNDFDRQCNEVEATGKKAFGKDWETISETVVTLGGFTTEEMVGILATDNPAQVIAELGKNPDKYHEVKDLPPAKRLAAFVKLGLTPTKVAAKPSEAPAPVEPVAGRPGPVTAPLDDKLSDDEWHKNRDIERRKRWEAKNGVGARA